ncbi:MAG TPA: hypothetical protein DEH78_33560 [Solibacterales bacterium]|nr:hypothetical protein [Bryobacterales bacterium]
MLVSLGGVCQLAALTALLSDLPAPAPPPPADGVNAVPKVINPLTGAIGQIQNGVYTPLTSQQRAQLWWRTNVWGPGPIGRAFFTALPDHLEETPSEWGTGAPGYGRRVLSRYGRFAVQNSIDAAGSWAMGLDPRYVRCPCSGFWRRSWHAFHMNFLAYNNEGKKRLAVPRLAGEYGGMIAVVAMWYPNRLDPLKEGVRQGHQQVIYAAFSNLIREFWPELTRPLRKLRRP